ncbi:hypothetical protein [Hydrogenophaga sp. BPS33]|uniref:hypothetical protein n=1 Tax=Hydrogenophaga sp. BPS33 TaxID=2651974 RepID=UPI00191767BF|nr:hypothetical protein [Hydrogenophaga sp. BPS33]
MLHLDAEIDSLSLLLEEAGEPPACRALAETGAPAGGAQRGVRSWARTSRKSDKNIGCDWALVKRLLAVLNERLKGRRWIIGDE